MGRVKTSAALGLFFCFFYALLRAPLYNFDGFSYALQGQTPLEDINPHHLLWIPVQAVFVRLAGLLHADAAAVCQVGGIVIAAAVLAFTHALFRRAGLKPGMAAVAALAIAMTPSWSFLATQNEPYMLFFAGVLIGGACLLPADRLSMPRVISSAIAFAAAVHFQQAAALMALPVIFWLPSRWRWRWAAAFALAVGVPYISIAWAMDIRSPNELRGWLTGYLETQHPLQWGWRVPARVAVGICRSLVESTAIEGELLRRCSYPALWISYSLAGLAAAVVVTRRALANSALIRKDAELRLWCGLSLAWLLFVVLWEPATGYYWALLFPLATLIVGRSVIMTPAKERRIFLVALTLSAWNVGATVYQNRSNALRAPTPWVTLLEQRLGPEDRLLTLDRARYGATDYDLIQYCLERKNAGQKMSSFLSDWVLANPSGWPDSFGKGLRDLSLKRGRLYLSSWIFRRDAYADLVDDQSPFSIYPHPKFKTIDGEAARQALEGLLKPYAPHPSDLNIAGDPLWVIDPRP